MFFVLFGQAPALIDSWDQALLTVPLFVLLEVMFSLGNRKQFNQKKMLQVNANVTKLNDSKVK
jgi:uncharacterized membrane protein YGL010W